MMVVNGAGSPIDVFSTTASLATNTTYFFSAWVASVYPLSPAQLQFSQDGTLLGSTFTASSAVGLWQLFEASFTTGSSVPALSTFAIVNQNTALSGNDFALDDIILGTSDQAVPEPATYGMMLAGLGVVFCLRKRG